MSKKQLQDERLLCGRCGVTFLWTVEEQQRWQEPEPPERCPGCRRLLPPPGRERGLVKWYDPRRKFGFIVPTHGPELYVHGRQLQGIRRLYPGDLVEFGVESQERGPVAVAVRLVERGRRRKRSAQRQAQG